MAKIKDRVLLGFAAGLGANTLKLSLGLIFKKLKWADIDGPVRAAGMLIPPHTVAKKSGKLVGYLADSAIASLIGIGAVYSLSVTGKDKSAFKGAMFGQAAWTFLYGALGTMGATKINPVSPGTVLSEFASHTAYGALVTTLATKLGDSSLFDGSNPICISPIKLQQTNQTNDKVVVLSRVFRKLNFLLGTNPWFFPREA